MSNKSLHELTRRAFLVAAGTGVLATSTGRAQSRGKSPQKPPNVVYLFSDEHRWHSMSFTELPKVQTPHMARLAAEGTQSTQCISNYPVCSPYRAMLLTGRWPYETGIVDNNLPLRTDEVTLGKAFQSAGYRTGYIGKWHLVGTRAEPFGFDESLIWDKTNVHWDESEYYPASGNPVTPKGYNATLMTDQALDFMEANKSKPFNLVVSWNPPHASFVDPPEEKKALYPQGSLPYRPNWQATPKASDLTDLSEETKIFKENSWPHYEGYHAHISAIDDELGRVLAKLEELGIEDNTILVYTSDHGSMFGSQGLGGKRQPYEESIRVPFLIRWPGRVRAKKKMNALFGTIDIMPTICALAGIGVPQSCRGFDFSGHFLGSGGPNPESQFIMHLRKENASGKQNHPAPIFRGVRTKRHTYVITDKGKRALYDNRNDPYQMENIVKSRESRRIREACEAMTLAWLNKAADPFVVPKSDLV